MLRQAGPRSCVKRWPIPAAKRLKDSFIILQKSMIIPFNWSSYGKTFTGNRILRLEVAHFFFFWKSSNKSLKKKLLFTHSYKANGSTPGLFLPILGGGSAVLVRLPWNCVPEWVNTVKTPWLGWVMVAQVQRALHIHEIGVSSIINIVIIIN